MPCQGGPLQWWNPRASTARDGDAFHGSIPEPPRLSMCLGLCSTSCATLRPLRVEVRRATHRTQR
eukprot:scaffold108870_cov33-Tisochrysis_lutea.AAC.2